MLFWIKNNNKIIKSVKLLNSIFYGFWFVLIIIKVIVQIYNKSKGIKSNLENILTLIGAILIINYLLFNFIHWLKPKWFENKN